MQNELPTNLRQPAVPHRHMTAGVIRDRRGRIVVVERHAEGLLGGLWKFPGGERRPGESLGSALVRTVRDELGIAVRVEKRVLVVKHDFTHFHMILHVFECRKTGGRIHAAACAGWRWVSPRNMRSLPFGKAERKILEVLV